MGDGGGESARGTSTNPNVTTSSFEMCSIYSRLRNLCLSVKYPPELRMYRFCLIRLFFFLYFGSKKGLIMYVCVCKII